MHSSQIDLLASKASGWLQERLASLKGLYTWPNKTDRKNQGVDRERDW